MNSNKLKLPEARKEIIRLEKEIAGSLESMREMEEKNEILNINLSMRDSEINKLREEVTQLNYTLRIERTKLAAGGVK